MFGPIAPENNPPINPQYYEPSVYTISAIGLGVLTTITTSVNHDYVVGQLVRLAIPQPNGATQLNETQSYVVSISAPNQVITDLNSTKSNPFIASTPNDQWQPQIMAIGDINSGTINMGRSNNGTTIPGAFRDVSPL